MRQRPVQLPLLPEHDCPAAGRRAQRRRLVGIDLDVRIGTWDAQNGLNTKEGEHG